MQSILGIKELHTQAAQSVREETAYNGKENTFSCHITP